MSEQKLVIQIGGDVLFYCGAYHGLPEKITDLDFSFLNIDFIKLGSLEFYNRMKSISGDDWNHLTNSAFNRLLRENPMKPIFIAFPKDINQGLSTSILYNFEIFFQIMFPSHFKLSLTVGFNEAEKLNLFRECYSMDRSNAINQQFTLWQKTLDFDLGQSKIIIDTLKLMFNRYAGLKKEYELLFECYQNSFYQWSLDMAIINLTMSLESLIKTETEINHQIARTVAILNSNNKEEGNVIYSNVKKLYGLRSKIVHGDKPKSDFKHYYIALKAIVSRTIIEIIIFNLKKEKLRELIIQSGFGSRNTFTENYTPSIVNNETITLLKEKLKNLK
jgi:hypothetical protein